VYRPDIYALAAKELIAEGVIEASAFPDFATETGFKPPQKHFIDNIVYDGTQPNAYLDKFAIGLKQDDTL
jgi:nitrate/nitrite transport system substrate-binding protein